MNIELTEDSNSGDELIPWLGWAAATSIKMAPLDNSSQFLKDSLPLRKTLAPVRKKGTFTCLKCDRSYVRKDSLQRHVQWECGIEPQFPCPFCPQKCKRKAHQIRHIQRRHKDKIGMLEENNPNFKF